jgi:hypothetical protein
MMNIDEAILVQGPQKHHALSLALLGSGLNDLASVIDVQPIAAIFVLY